MHSPSPREDVARLRDEIPSKIAEMGDQSAIDALQRIAGCLPDDDAIWIQWKRNDALTIFRRSSYRPPRVSIVLDLVQRAESRWVADEDDLLELVIESLERLQKNLGQTINSKRAQFWLDQKPKKGGKLWKPKSETEMAESTALWLQGNLASGKGILVQREIQIQFNKRTDIEVSAVTTASEGLRPLQIVIEAKGCWHADIKSAHQDQLVADYLRKSGRTHGVYLIFWTKSSDPSSKFQDKRSTKLKVRTSEAAQAKIEELVHDIDGSNQPEVVAGYVLDVSM